MYNKLYDTFHLISQVHLSTKLNHHHSSEPGLIFMINRFDIVRIPDRKFGEGDLRLQHRSLTPYIVSLPILRHELITHGNILSIVITMLLKRWHPTNAVVISLQVSRFKTMVPRVIVVGNFAKRGLP